MLWLQIPRKDGSVESDTIQFWNGELKGDSFSPAMYTLTTNPVSWKIRSFQGYVLSKPIKEKVTHALFIDDLKCYAKKKLVKKTIMTIIKMHERFWVVMEQQKVQACKSYKR